MKCWARGSLDYQTQITKLSSKFIPSQGADVLGVKVGGTKMKLIFLSEALIQGCHSYYPSIAFPEI